MNRAQNLYARAVRNLPFEEQLALAAIILEELTRSRYDRTPQKHYAIDLLENEGGPGLFATSEEADHYLHEERESWDR